MRRPSGSLLCEPGVARVPAPSHRPELSFSRSASQTHGCQRTPGREKCKVTDGGHGRGVDPCARAWESCGMESPGIPGALQSRQLDSLWPGVTGAARGHRVRGKEAQFPSSNTRPLQETRDPERHLCQQPAGLPAPAARFPGATPRPPSDAEGLLATC